MDAQTSTPLPGPASANTVKSGSCDPELAICRSQLFTAIAESGGGQFPFPAAAFPNDTAYRTLRRELADSGWSMNLVVDLDNGDYFNIAPRD